MLSTPCRHMAYCEDVSDTDRLKPGITEVTRMYKWFIFVWTLKLGGGGPIMLWQTASYVLNHVCLWYLLFVFPGVDLVSLLWIYFPRVLTSVSARERDPLHKQSARFNYISAVIHVAVTPGLAIDSTAADCFPCWWCKGCDPAHFLLTGFWARMLSTRVGVRPGVVRKWLGCCD